MDFLLYIPDELKSEVETIVDNPEMSNEQKLEFLKDILTSPTLMKICKDYLDNKDGTPPVSPAAFINLLPESHRRIALLRLQREEIEGLDSLVLRLHDVNLKKSYETWKKHYNQEYYDKELQRPPFKDTQISMVASNDVLKKLPKETNIVFLGGTGSGKSTCINSFVNYMTYKTLEAAERAGPIVLIPTEFTQTDSNMADHKIFAEATVRSENERQNETLKAGQSSTLSPRAYKFSYKVENQTKIIRVIDTPGFADTRGYTDKLNMEKILQFLGQYSEIHAFCFTMKSNESRRTLQFRYCVNELLVNLHGSAAKNIKFCLTNSGATQYRPGDSLPTLRVHVAEIKKDRNVNIEVDGSTVHCFENDSFRYLCALKSGRAITFSEQQKKLFGYSWDESVKAASSLLASIANLQPHKVSDTMSIYDARSVINILGKPLAEIYRTQVLNRQIINEKRAEIRECISKGVSTSGRLKLHEVSLIAEPTERPITVCTSESCVGHETLIQGGHLETVFKTECHKECHLREIEKETYPNPGLKACWAMDKDGKCRICTCDWSTHQHVYYRLKKGVATVAFAARTASLFLKKLEERKEELERDQQKMLNYCAEFACFARDNAILHYSDAFGEYMDLLIREEQVKVSVGGLDDVLYVLRATKEEYENQVKFINENKGRQAKSAEEIYRMIKELYRLNTNGSVLRTVQEIKMRCSRRAMDRVTPDVLIRSELRLWNSVTPSTQV